MISILFFKSRNFSLLSVPVAYRILPKISSKMPSEAICYVKNSKHLNSTSKLLELGGEYFCKAPENLKRYFTTSYEFNSDLETCSSASSHSSSEDSLTDRNLDDNSTSINHQNKSKSKHVKKVRKKNSKNKRSKVKSKSKTELDSKVEKASAVKVRLIKYRLEVDTKSSSIVIQCYVHFLNSLRNIDTWVNYTDLTNDLEKIKFASKEHKLLHNKSLRNKNKNNSTRNLLVANNLLAANSSNVSHANHNLHISNREKTDNGSNTGTKSNSETTSNFDENSHFPYGMGSLFHNSDSGYSGKETNQDVNQFYSENSENLNSGSSNLAGNHGPSHSNQSHSNSKTVSNSLSNRSKTISDKLEQEYQKLTNVKFVNQVFFDNKILTPHYWSPILSRHDTPNDTVYVCPNSLNFFDNYKDYENLRSKTLKIPKNSRLVYEVDISKFSRCNTPNIFEQQEKSSAKSEIEILKVYEMNPAKSKDLLAYTQKLAVFSKLFIDHKTLFFDLENDFIFYVLFLNDKFVGYFSKELGVEENDAYNHLSCFVVLPQYQKRGFGLFLASLADIIAIRLNTHKISNLEETTSQMSTSTSVSDHQENSSKINSLKRLTSGPEFPLSPSGRKTYFKYWKYKIEKCFSRFEREHTEILLENSSGRKSLVESRKRTLVEAFGNEIANIFTEQPNGIGNVYANKAGSKMAKTNTGFGGDDLRIFSKLALLRSGAS